MAEKKTHWEQYWGVYFLGILTLKLLVTGFKLYGCQRDAEWCSQRFGSLFTNKTDADVYRDGYYCCAEESNYDPQAPFLFSKTHCVEIKQ